MSYSGSSALKLRPSAICEYANISLGSKAYLGGVGAAGGCLGAADESGGVGVFDVWIAGGESAEFSASTFFRSRGVPHFSHNLVMGLFDSPQAGQIFIDISGGLKHMVRS